MWKAVESLFPAKSFAKGVSAGNAAKIVSALVNNTWQIGLDPSGVFFGTLPNGVGTFRVMLNGELTVMLFPLLELVPCLRIQLGRDGVSSRDLKGVLE